MLLLLCAICYNNNHGGSGKKNSRDEWHLPLIFEKFPLLHSCFLRHNFVSMLPSVINMSHFDYNCRWVNKIMREGGQKTKINRYISFTKRLNDQNYYKWLDGVYYFSFAILRLSPIFLRWTTSNHRFVWVNTS